MKNGLHKRNAGGGIARISVILMLIGSCQAGVTAARVSEWEAEYRKTSRGKRSPVDTVIPRIEALLGHLQSMPGAGDLSTLESRFRETKARWKGMVRTKSPGAATGELEVYTTLREIQRRAQWRHPELQEFDDILFLGYMRPSGQNHMCDQYYGWNVRNGGGLYILKNFKSDDPTLVNLLENSTVRNGRLAGRKLTGGAFLSPDLSFDARTIAFAWSSEAEKCWHIFKVDADGGNLVQLTDGRAPRNRPAYAGTSRNDFDPCFLPNGRIVFVSERRGGYLRCSPGRPCPTYTLYSMKDDGSDIIQLSYHETNEWHPSVNNDGMIVYTRWDYVDRDDMTAHHIWTCYPDGRDPRSLHGNYPLPYDTFDEPGHRFPVAAREGIVDYDGRFARPIGEWNIRAIPGSQKYVATAAGHHSHSFGSLVMIDLRTVDDNATSQLTAITSRQPKHGDKGGPYGTAWPLGEDLYLCSFNDSLVTFDRFGNRDVIYRAASLPADKIIDPIPLIPRKRPPIIPTLTHQGENLKDDSPNATISIMNAYTSDTPLPRGVKIKWVRVVQLIPQLQARMNSPSIGYATESLARVPLGVVPVEEDGSVYLTAPVEKEIYFQLLDENGMAVHSMRSGTYVHPGEQMSCVGCHEDKWKLPPTHPRPLALQRAPSELTPEVSRGAIPYNWHLLVKPVLEENCGSCHHPGGTPPDLSYGSLKNYAYFTPYWSPGQGGKRSNTYANGEIKASGSRTRPGRFGAHESRLYKGGYLSNSHYKVDLTKEELRRITLWLDLNSNELGAYTQVDEQRQGKVVWPELDMDPENPTGVETRGRAGYQTEAKAPKGE